MNKTDATGRMDAGPDEVSAAVGEEPGYAADYPGCYLVPASD